MHVKVPLGTNNDKEELIDVKTNGMEYESGGTNTHLAIEELTSMLTDKLVYKLSNHVER